MVGQNVWLPGQVHFYLLYLLINSVLHSPAQLFMEDSVLFGVGFV